jgi:hypothetical protein
MQERKTRRFVPIAHQETPRQVTWPFWIFVSIILGISSALADPSTPAAAPDNTPITQEQFKQWTNWMKRSVDVLDKREKRLESEQGQSKGAGADGAVDLSTLDSAPSGKSSVGAVAPEAQGPAQPMFKSYFDFNVVNRPGTQDNFTFDNYHSFLFFEIVPSPTVMFTFDVNPTAPKFYELDWQATKRLTLRVGKIFIPFDDISSQSPHNIFGGRVGISRLSLDPSGATFLPDVWADLGIGAKYVFVDTSALLMEGHLYVVDGFQDGGTDPNPNDPAGTPYPNFSQNGGLVTGNAADNNRDKSVGARLHLLFGSRWGLGGSVYTGRWTADNGANAAPSERVMAYGLDSQLRLNWAEFRVGLALMNVGMPVGSSFNRSGTYGEIGHHFGYLDRWKILGRVGTLDLDSRVDSITDETIVGGTILYRPGFVEFSLEYSRDLNYDYPLKPNHSYTDLRCVMAF